MIKLNAFSILPSRLPFDWKNPKGYLIAVVIQYIFTFNTTFAAASVVTLLIGAYIAISLLVHDLINTIGSFHKNIQQKKNRNKCPAQLFAFITLHSSAKQLSQSQIAKKKTNEMKSNTFLQIGQRFFIGVPAIIYIHIFMEHSSDRSHYAIITGSTSWVFQFILRYECVFLFAYEFLFQFQFRYNQMQRHYFCSVKC